MRNITIIICIILILNACNAQKKEKPIDTAQDEVLQSVVEKDHKQDNQKYFHETLILSRSRLEEMTMLEIIDLYIEQVYVNENPVRKMIYVGDGTQGRQSSFEFISHNEINWHPNYNIELIFFPSLYIIDDNNIRVEIFNGTRGDGYGLIGSHYSVRKLYIDISKEELIDLYLGIVPFIENYNRTEYFELNKVTYTGDEIILKTLVDTDVYVSGTISGEIISRIQKGVDVEIIDIYYKNIKTDNYPVSVRIKTENLTGWINVNNVDFFKKEQEGIANGVWLHDSVKKVINIYGQERMDSGQIYKPRVVSGKTFTGSVPVRALPANNSERLYVLQKDIELYITDVSDTVDNINGIEAAWYKIYVDPYNVNYDEMNSYEVIGWVFGSYLEIHPGVILPRR